MASATQPVQPIFLDAGIIFVSGGVPPTLGVAFGTGYRANLLKSNGTNVNRFHFVLDTGGAKTLHDTDLVNLTPTGGVTSAATGPAPTTAGYFLDFATFNEKAVSTVFSTLGNLSLVAPLVAGYPLVTVLLGAELLQEERLTVRTVAGALLIVGAIAYLVAGA